METELWPKALAWSTQKMCNLKYSSLNEVAAFGQSVGEQRLFKSFQCMCSFSKYENLKQINIYFQKSFHWTRKSFEKIFLWKLAEVVLCLWGKRGSIKVRGNVDDGHHLICGVFSSKSYHHFSTFWDQSINHQPIRFGDCLLPLALQNISQLQSAWYNSEASFWNYSYCTTNYVSYDTMYYQLYCLTFNLEKILQLILQFLKHFQSPESWAIQWAKRIVHLGTWNCSLILNW